MAFTGSRLEQDDPKKRGWGLVGRAWCSVIHMVPPLQEITMWAGSGTFRDSGLGAGLKDLVIFPPPHWYLLQPFSLKSLVGVRACVRMAPNQVEGATSPQCCTVGNRALTALV